MANNIENPATFKSVHQEAEDQYIKVFTATVVKNGTQSSAVNLEGRAPIRLNMNAGWKGTSPVVKFQVRETSGAGYLPLWSGGTAYTVAVKKSQAVRVDPTIFSGVNYIKLSSTTARGTAVTQGTIAPIGIVARLT